MKPIAQSHLLSFGLAFTFALLFGFVQYWNLQSNPYYSAGTGFYVISLPLQIFVLFFWFWRQQQASLLSSIGKSLGLGLLYGLIGLAAVIAVYFHFGGKP